MYVLYKSRRKSKVFRRLEMDAWKVSNFFLWTCMPRENYLCQLISYLDQEMFELAQNR